jgi:hypothetical protein
LLASQDFTHLKLYNLATDAGERTDLRTREPARLQAMRRRLEILNAEIEKEGSDWWKRLSPDGGGFLAK